MLEVKFEEKPDIYKELYYAAGKLYEIMKNPQAAEEAYQKILEVDYSYRNTVNRLNKLQGGGDGPAN
jgi:tetratricopeptide (TPR) repeat protein